MKLDILRRCIFRPYAKGKGPVFSLTTYDTGRLDNRGCTLIGYSFRQDGKVLFKGEDYSTGMGSCDDDNASIAGLMGFLTLRPGDTDPEYFEKYTDAQIAFCENHAETLSAEVSFRFGEY